MTGERRPGPYAAGIVALWVAAACSTPSVDGVAPSYDPTALTSGVLYHWRVGTDISIHVVPHPGAHELLDAAARVSAGRWQAALGYREHTIGFVADPAAAHIVIRDARSPAPVSTACGGPGWTDAAATTFFCPLGDTARTLPMVTGSQSRVKVLITIDVEATSADALTPVVLHEIGHALGIGGHSPVATDAMFAVPSVITPSARDARTLRYLLHRRPDLTL